MISGREAVEVEPILDALPKLEQYDFLNNICFLFTAIVVSHVHHVFQC